MVFDRIRRVISFRIGAMACEITVAGMRNERMVKGGKSRSALREFHNFSEYM